MNSYVRKHLRRLNYKLAMDLGMMPNVCPIVRKINAKTNAIQYPRNGSVTPVLKFTKANASVIVFLKIAMS